MTAAPRQSPSPDGPTPDGPAPDGPAPADAPEGPTAPGGDGLAARRAAFALLTAVLERKRPLDEALERTPGLDALAARDRAFVRLLVLTVLRRLGQIDRLIDGYVTRPPKGKGQRVRFVLRLGLAQILVLGTPAHAAVDTAVALAQAEGLATFKGLVNAVLRRAAREAPDLVGDADAPRRNTPDWLWESWSAAYGETTARAIATVHLGEPPLDLTVRDPAAVADWAARLEGTALAGETVRLTGTADVRALPGYAEGAWWVQDAAAALPARILRAALGGDLSGRRIVDLCAAPGGKTAQLAALGAEVVAVDRSAARLERLRANLGRLGLSAAVAAADAEQWRPEAPADAVLLDAPCTATGTLRRHPDIAHLKGPADVDRLAALQARLIAAAAAMVKPGGFVVYATCSLQPAEGPGAVAAALDAGAPLAAEPVPPAALGRFAEAVTESGHMRTRPDMAADVGGCDGFFAALLRREN